MEAEVEQVLTICPHVDEDDVIRDLQCTGNAEETINRIFDGTFLSVPEEEQSPSREFPSYRLNTSPHHECINHATDDIDIEIPRCSLNTRLHCEDNINLGSDDELPDIGLANTKTAIKPITAIPECGPTFQNKLVSREGGDSDDEEDINLLNTSKSLTSLESPSDGKLGHVDRWIQQNRLSGANESKNRSETFGKSSENNELYADDITVRDNRRPLNGYKKSVATSSKKSKAKDRVKNERQRRISISSSEEEVEFATDHNLVLNSKTCTSEKVLFHQNKAPESPKNMKRSCSPISVSDSDDDEELLSLSLKHRIQGHPSLPDNGSSQSTMCSMDYDTEPVDSSTQQTGETYSSVETSSTYSKATDSQDPSKKKRKRTPEEIEESKLQALEKKRQRELAKEAKKREKEKAKEERKALQAARKADRPEECMKYVRVVLDPTLLEEVGGAAILAKLESLDSKYTIEPQAVPAMVIWRRLGTGLNLGEDIELQSICTERDECETLVLLPTSNFVDMVYVFKQEQQGTYCTGMESLRSYTQSLQRTLKGKQVTFMVMSMEKYFRNQKNSHNRQFRSAVLGTQGNEGKPKRRKKGVEEITTFVSRVDVEEALVDLQLHTHCNVRFAEKPDEVAELIAMFTKSVAETPFKRDRDKATFSFHVDTEWAGGIRVSKDGAGLLRVWRQHLQQFRNVSPEIASAIVAVYPSPRLLIQAYGRCSTVSEAQKLLQGIMIRRGEGVLATSRRVGGALSKRIHTLLTSHNGDLVL